ncbi:MAG: chemotaxis protein CheR [Deltaproteobacteria bacterium HGW-Deltaproteobacteria-22]|jgi:two-component system CheB/CheR fusion protein|nr:MAG: chemotaxis protein CheR [Deltaproteobacteria bacterium HGW-Deltaproteobacteria-22]
MTRKKKTPTQPVDDTPVVKAPASSEPAFPVVGIGASAGGLAAFEAFFSGMPPVISDAGDDSHPLDTGPGMAFVLVQHLAPDHKSILTELIQRCTRMPVFEVEDQMVVRPDCVYIIPPGHDMAFLNGELHLLQPSAPRGQRLPIDFFFRSLAQDLRDRAIAIVLSGSGSDGTLGVRAIKGEGGMVMVQSPSSTEYDSMPRSALATGLVDYELPPSEMPAHLISYIAHALGRSLREPVPVIANENALKKIFVLLRNQTGHDFSQYKPSTIHRRIGRRMAVLQIEAMTDYMRFLQQTTAEVEALFRDLLIGVTSFFRDPEVFGTLEELVIPRLFDGKSDEAVIRVWSPGCSTGEEAYSLAILLAERQEVMKRTFKVQVFATDIDSAAIATARAGLYPASIAADLTPDRLSRFFTAEGDGGMFRIRKGIRDMLIFSEQDVIKDPPFSRLDLISCRNLLIYLGGDLQKRLIPMFRFALRPGGFLFLGTSETIGEFDDLFTVLDRKAKLYQCGDQLHGEKRALHSRLQPPVTALSSSPPRQAGRKAAVGTLPLRELTEQALLLQFAPAGALVDNSGDILYLHGRLGLYLEPPPGVAGISNIVRMAREGLRLELSAALHEAGKTLEIVRRDGLDVRTNAHFTRVNLTILPVPGRPGGPGHPDAVEGEGSEHQLFLVVLEEAPETDPVDLGTATPAPEMSKKIESQLAMLTKELRLKEEYLQSAIEELETSNEELKSSNEELQSVNEEMQSTNEELETSKEEMQSVNEEMSTINAELQNKVTDLSRANNGMSNLMAGTGIATVFVDLHKRILRFTPSASGILNLIPGDVGRPVGHLVSNLADYTDLVPDVQKVLDTLIPYEAEVQTLDGKGYLLRIHPYRTLENVIEGAVITFIDITEMQLMRTALTKANDLLRLAVVVRDSRDAITVQDLSGRVLAWNPGAVRMYGFSEAQALGMNIRDCIPEPLREEALSRVHQLSRAQVLEPYLTRRVAKDGTILEVSMISTALVNEAGQTYAITTTERLRGGTP